ncbi:hypothetical protein GBB97_08705 [Bifidobacterium longum]|uniref:Uncharacterized protein n=4 Tax=Bifidobacterium longum TaxID=216816 RepID=A0A133LL44_BIFLN|nr:hypothetical protein BLIG_01744 [Bifidobacterium longum subsp. infantis CCUG 52486]KAB6720010.1 hypothetical protein GBL36_09060 [Bifidobacterium longum]MBD3900340.1 hypothetical protein [Bifidobacterium longum subsp. longum]KAB6720209.1 hypothetical protein GBL29_09100 [Bifidobacterium longum]KAB6720651.1 hypothetical protein GBL27_09200 [Bifidobacterium longum]
MSSLMVSSHSAATSNVSRYFHCMDKGSYCEHCYGITVNDYVRCPRLAHAAALAPSALPARQPRLTICMARPSSIRWKPCFW